jgi:hypothetical protein
MQKGLCFYCGAQGHRAIDCPQKKNRPKKPFKKQEGPKPNTKEAFSHIKKLVAELEQDQFEELAERMNKLGLPTDDLDFF